MACRRKNKIDIRPAMLAVGGILSLSILMSDLCVADDAGTVPKKDWYLLQSAQGQSIYLRSYNNPREHPGSNGTPIQDGDHRTDIYDIPQTGYRADSNEFHAAPPPIKRSKSATFQKLMDGHPAIKAWVEPVIDSGATSTNGVGLKWNPLKPGKAAVQVRPFHLLKSEADGLRQIEISGRLFGEQDDLKACYPINSSTSAQIVQRDGSSSISLNFSRPF